MNGQTAAVKWKGFSHSRNVGPADPSYSTNNCIIFNHLQGLQRRICEPRLASNLHFVEGR